MKSVIFGNIMSLLRYHYYKVGACLVDKNNVIVGFGYNGFPLNIDDKDPKVNWNKEEKQKVGEHNNCYYFKVTAIQ